MLNVASFLVLSVPVTCSAKSPSAVVLGQSSTLALCVGRALTDDFHGEKPSMSATEFPQRAFLFFFCCPHVRKLKLNKTHHTSRQHLLVPCVAAHLCWVLCFRFREPFRSNPRTLVILGALDTRMCFSFWGDKVMGFP